MMCNRTVIALSGIASLLASYSTAQAQDVNAQLNQMRQMCRQTQQTAVASCNRASSSSGSSSRSGQPSSGRYETEQRGGGAVVDRGGGNSGPQCVAKAKQETASCLMRVDALAKELQGGRGRR